MSKTEFSPAMESALKQLFQMIKNGVEFPDACWIAAKKHGFMVDELRQAYDIRCQEM